MIGITDGLLAAVCVLAAGYYLFTFWLKRKLNFWKDRGVKQWDTNSFFGNYKDMVMLKCVEPDIVDKAYDMFSNEKYAGLYFFWKPQFLPLDQELIKKIFLNDFEHFTDHVPISNYKGSDRIMHNLFFAKGDVWKTYRAAFVQMFTPSKLKSMLVPVEKLFIEEVVPSFEAAATPPTSADGGDVYLTKIIDDFTSLAVIKVFIGLHVDGPDNKINEIAKKFSFPEAKTAIKFIMFQIMPTIYKLLGLQTVDGEVCEYFTGLAKEVMKMKASQGRLGSDLMSFFQKCKLGEIKSLKNVSDEFIAAHLFVFYIAGNDTSSFTLAYALFELARNPDVQDKLREEVERLTKEEGEVITYEFTKKMTYADKVLQESTRMYPALGVLNRVCSREYKVDDNLTLPSGTPIVIPCRALHYDPHYFPDPHVFNPDRFNDGVPWAWMPFGKGPRQCIGMRFSEMEMKAALAHIIKRYDITPSPKMKLPITFNPHSLMVSNKPVGGIWVRMRKRDNK